MLHQDGVCCNVSLVVDALKWHLLFSLFPLYATFVSFSFFVNVVIIYCTHVRMHACVGLHNEIQQNNWHED